MRMKGKSGIVTAGASGIGRSGALRLAKEGARVAVVDLDKAAADELVRAIRQSGGEATALVGDLSSEAFARSIADDAFAAFGQLDFLWNHVGVPGPSAFEDLDMDDYDRAFNLNVRSSVATTIAAVPYLRRAGGGSVLFTASTSAILGSPLSPVYSATKAAIVGLTKSLAKRFGPDNIRLNCVSPGSTDTPMLREFFNRGDSARTASDVEDVIKTRSSAYPLRRIATPEDIANAALFLLSDEASFITGTMLVVDGGLTA
ncbi:MAG: SDR family oxidoreductase [Pseudomonadota bacterium]|nr:SDR family oxidoreductase [Pseudomonadota bacterium]